MRYSKSSTGVIWQPQRGKQTLAATCPADETFFAGTRGGGKSDVLVGRHIQGARRYGVGWNGLIVRRKYKDFNELRRRWDELERMGLPSERVGGEQQTNFVRFENGAVVQMSAINRLEQADDFIGHQFTEISVDEAPSIPFISNLIDKLRGSLRSPHGVPCHFFLTGNPGGPGASMVKQMYIPTTMGGGSPVGAGKVNRVVTTLDDGTQFTISRIFIQSTLSDNRILCENDPNYIRQLMAIKDPALRAAWLEGRWDVFIGQAFNFTERNIIKPIWPIPEYAPLYMTYDWGWGAPFSIGWWWVDGDNRVYRFAEWYGWDKVTPNKGIRLTDEQVAQGVIEYETKLGVRNRPITRLAGPDSFAKKPDYKGGGQGPSTAEIFEGYGIKLIAGDPKREIKIRRFRSRIEPNPDKSIMPMLVVYDTCKQFIRIMPSLCVDELTGEYLEDGQEDHPFDEACHICMARPWGVDIDEVLRKEEAEKKKQQLESLDAVSRAASREFTRKAENIKANQEEFHADIEFDDDGVPMGLDAGIPVT